MIARFVTPIFTIFVCAAGAALAGESGSRSLGTGRHLFIDPALVRDSSGITLEVMPPTKRGVVLRANDPDRTHIGKYGTVLADGDGFHMWYMAHTNVAPKGGTGESSGRAYVCYARSSDGVNWTKPKLELAQPFPGAEPNIVVGWGAGGFAENMEDSANVFIDPNAPAAERFKLGVREVVLTKDPGKFGLHLLASADGINWKLRRRDVLNYWAPMPHLDTENIIFWDPARKTYRAYARYNIRPPWGGRSRAIAYGESTSLESLPYIEKMQVLFAHDGLDPQLPSPTKSREVRVLDYYTNATFRYPWAENAYFMFPSVYFHYVTELGGAFAEKQPTNAGVNDIRFAASTDGVEWQRFDRRPYLRLGHEGTWDSKEIYLLHGMVPDGDAGLRLYYFGTDRCHGWGRDEQNQRLLRAAGLAPVLDTSGVGLLEVRRDGFVAARADYGGGEFTTSVVNFAGNELVLNLDTSAAGDARVEIRDAHGIPIEGFTLAECDRIHTANQINRRVTWKGRTGWRESPYDCVLFCATPTCTPCNFAPPSRRSGGRRNEVGVVRPPGCGDVWENLRSARRDNANLRFDHRSAAGWLARSRRRRRFTRRWPGG
jgi:hypothetical protein